MVVGGGDGDGDGCGGGGSDALYNGLLVSCGLPPQVERKRRQSSEAKR